MKTLAQSPLSCANAAFRNGDFESAIALYEEALDQTEEPLKACIRFNLDLALRRLNSFSRPATAALEKPEGLDQFYFDLIEQGGFFDSAWYLAQYKDQHHITGNPLAHYLARGVALSTNPSPNFDTEYYVKTHQDVVTSGMHPFLHYVCQGHKEDRPAKSAALDGSLDQYTIEAPQSKNESQQPLLTTAVKVPEIDNGFSSIDKVGIESLDDYNRGIYESIKNKGLDWSQYFSKNSHEFLSNDPIVDYLLSWKVSAPVIPEYFDTEFYLESYPDIKESGINPLWHYAIHGCAEGRIACLHADNVVNGYAKFDNTKEIIVFVSHESSASGAPLLGYNIADALNEKYNIIHIVIRKSNIHEAFLKNCYVMLQSIEGVVKVSSLIFLRDIAKRNRIKCVVINSIVGYQVMDAANIIGIPIMFLVHEFSEYMRPLGTMMNTVLKSDVVVIPATVIQDSIMKEFARYTDHKALPSNLHIIPQGKLPCIPGEYGENDDVECLYKKLNISSPEDFKIIVASGWVQIRKGVDLFVLTARYIKSLYGGKCKFVWVGDGFDPDNDLAYSVYLEREIEFSGLGDDFMFLGHQRNLDTIFSIADVFCLTSRMDPFPNVVIDALGHDLHIASFNHACGSSEFLLKHNANCTVVDFVDTHAMAEGIVDYLNAGNRSEGVNKQIAREHLDFCQYKTKLEQLIQVAVDFKSKSNHIVDYLLSSGEFDPEFHGGNGTAKEICRRYVENSLKGIHFKSPKSGFSDSIWLSENQKSGSFVVPLYESLCKGQSKTHDVLCFPNSLAWKNTSAYAVHLHLYYIDLAPFFVGYFKNLPGVFDLFITIVDVDDLAVVEQNFSKCGARKVEVIVVENIGRDIGPFIFTVGKLIKNNGYQIVGHFHSKKSANIALGEGDKWLKFLMENLIGDNQMASGVLAIFDDPEIGLVFPEESRFVDIGENKKFVSKLCEMLNIPTLDATPIFPVGNMFWARVDAINKLFDLEPGKVLQCEPLPYDGSYMHAIERIGPHLVAQSGYKTLVIRRLGSSRAD